MPDLLYLEWERAADGYAIERLTSEDELRARGMKERWIGLLLEPRFQTDPLFVVPKGKAKKRYRPLVEHDALFRQFAELQQTPEAVAGFASDFGLLGLFEPFEPVIEWYDFIWYMKTAVDEWEAAKKSGDLAPTIDRLNAIEGVQMRVRLSRGADSTKAILRLQPPSLWHGLRLQFAQAVASSDRLRKCAICPTWFRYGTGTGRRKSGDYCSDRCRKAYWRQQQKEKNQ